MGCRCNERRGAIISTVRAIGEGDAKAATEQATFVVKSTIEDAKNTFRQSVAAARSRLTRR